MIQKKVALLIPAAGQGKRIRSKTLKPFIEVAGQPLLIHALRRLCAACDFEEIIIACPIKSLKKFQACLGRFKLNHVRLVEGGQTRAASVRNAVQAVSKDVHWVMIHDAARPLVSQNLVASPLKEAARTGAAIPALSISSTVKKSDLKGRYVANTEDRRLLFFAQTPQVFKKDLLLRRYRALGQKALDCTDEAALFDGTATKVALVPGDPRNIKVTTPEDLELLRFYLG